MDVGELVNIIDMAYSISLVPVETNAKDGTMLVLGTKGNLFRMTFSLIKTVHLLYTKGKIDNKYMTRIEE